MSKRPPEDADVVEIAQRVCTRAQFAVVELAEAGFGYRTIARRLGIGVTTVRDRLDRAWERINAELVQE